jgi:hypothetical protein
MRHVEMFMNAERGQIEIWGMLDGRLTVVWHFRTDARSLAMRTIEEYLGWPRGSMNPQRRTTDK